MSTKEGNYSGFILHFVSDTKDTKTTNERRVKKSNVLNEQPAGPPNAVISFWKVSWAEVVGYVYPFRRA